MSTSFGNPLGIHPCPQPSNSQKPIGDSQAPKMSLLGLGLPMSVYRQAPRKQVEVHETRSLIEVQPRASSVSLTATVLNWEDEETIDSSLPSDFPAPRRSTKQSPTHSEDIMTFPLPPTIFVAGAEQDALDSNSEQSSWSPSTASPSDLQDRYENDELFSHSASFGDYDVSHIQEEEELPQVALPVFPPMGQALAELNDEDLKLATLGFGWLASIEGQSPLTELPVVEDTASWSSHTPEPFPSPPDSPCDDDGSASSCCLRREPSMAFSFSTASEASTAATSTHSSNTHHSSILCRARPVRKSSFCENTNFGITRHIIHTRHRDSKALSLLAAPAQGPETQQTIETAASESTATSHHNTLGRPLLAPHLISEYRSPGLHEPHGGLMGLLEEARENGRLQTVTKKNKGLSKWVRSGLRKMKKSSDLRGQARADETLFVLKEPPVKRVPSIDQCLYNN